MVVLSIEPGTMVARAGGERRRRRRRDPRKRGRSEVRESIAAGSLGCKAVKVSCDGLDDGGRDLKGMGRRIRCDASGPIMGLDAFVVFGWSHN